MIPPYDQSQDGFRLRFYEWSLAQLREEMALGFKRVSSTGVFTNTYVEAMSRIAPSFRERTAIACLKRAHRRATELLGEPLSKEELTLLERFTLLGIEVRAEERMRSTGLETVPPGARRKLVGEIKRELPAIVGPLEGANAHQGPRFLIYRREVSSFGLRTLFDATGAARHYDVGYGHWVTKEGEAPLLRDISWLHWLGIYATTTWRLRSEDQIPVVLGAIKTVTKQFVDALPALLPCDSVACDS